MKEQGSSKGTREEPQVVKALEIEQEFTHVIGVAEHNKLVSYQKANREMSRGVQKVERWYGGAVAALLSEKSSSHQSVLDKHQEDMRKLKKEIKRREAALGRNLEDAQRKVDEDIEAKMAELRRQKNKKLAPVEKAYHEARERAERAESKAIKQAEEVRVEMLQELSAESAAAEG